ncbi:peptide chain release factor N(5)-glutamine methyltransferase [Carnobacteriaceae bacterium zg-ZUI78]|nr:peptide chain release factor N(5)-glutamine methyltransferase [Carnobacteriaceae bacterium zg-ZUI78]
METNYATFIKKAQLEYSHRPDLVERLLCDRLDWTKSDLIYHLKDNVPKTIQEQFFKDFEKLKQGVPLQYIVGKEWFYGREFMVTKDTLIPRPETELLVEQVLNRMPIDAQIKVLDIGTGTGIIGLTIKLERPNSLVDMVDISKEALCVATHNAKQLHADVHCFESDVCSSVTEQYDVIVSNPPYISHDEVCDMDDSVLQYEPHLALFAQNNGYAIYEVLAKQLPAVLAKNGCVLLEIGYQQAEKLKKLFQQSFPDKYISVLKDYMGLDRMLIIEERRI